MRLLVTWDGSSGSANRLIPRPGKEPALDVGGLANGVSMDAEQLQFRRGAWSLEQPIRQT